MRSDKKTPLKSDKKTPSKVQKKGAIGYNKKSALLEDAITQMNAGKYGRASTVLKDLLALDPLNAEARRLFATLHLRLGSLMSARTAFESLAREAMERQDYWLAESLLREYLTAGPRCVPFLEMLGRVYEDKGDVMAAVAEYGKALEVCWKTRTQTIRTGRENCSAEFDPWLQEVRLPSALRPCSIPSRGRYCRPFLSLRRLSRSATFLQTAVPAESLADHTVAGAMPWEQMDSPPETIPAAGARFHRQKVDRWG